MLDIRFRRLLAICLGTASRGEAHENASLLIAGVASEIGAVEVWKVQLPHGHLKPGDYRASCASMNMQPVCAGSHTCQYADSKCIALDIEAGNCHSPMQGIAHSLGFDEPSFKHLCNYMVDPGGRENTARIEIGQNILGYSKKCVVVNEFVKCSRRVTREHPVGGLSESVIMLSWEIQVFGRQVCAERIDGNEDWSMDLVIDCEVQNLTDGVCGGDSGYVPGNSVMSPRYSLCAGFPLVERNAFLVDSGACVPHRDCISSPRFPNNYLDDDVCSITMMKAGTIRVVHFDTQRNRDVLTVQAIEYTGFHGPDGVVVGVGDEIQWRTDHTVSDSGWKICVQSNPGSWSPIASLACLLVIASVAFVIGRKSSHKSRNRLVEPLLGSMDSGNRNTNFIEKSLEPCIFDYYQNNRKFRCIQIIALGGQAADSARKIESQVHITQVAGDTRVHVTLTPEKDVSPSDEFLPCRALSFTNDSGLMQAWKWEKTLEFKDEVWELYDSSEVPTLSETLENDNVALHGVARIHLALVLPPVKMLEGGVDAESDMFHVASTMATSDSFDAEISDIGPSASATGEPSLETQQTCDAQLHEETNELLPRNSHSQEEDGEWSESSFVMAT